MVFALIALYSGIAPVAGAAETDPEADEILRGMSTYLAGLDAFRVDAEIDNEFVDLKGQKLQLTAGASVLFDRPAGFRITRQGGFADAEMIYDGKTLTLYGKRKNAYAQLAFAGDNDGAMRTIETETGIDFPGADLLFADPYAILSSGVNEGRYLGLSSVEGVTCHQLAFREENVDWQLWVRTGDEPLPMRYVITSKWVTGAPQYVVRLTRWDTKPSVGAAQFRFTPPKDARKLDSMNVDATGEPIVEGESR